MGPGRITDVSFSGVSTQYEVTMPVFGALTVFAQNTSISSMHRDGDEVWLSWAVDHAFGLADDTDGASPRFDADFDTSMIAVQSRKNLEAELEGA
jgi:spermidine/putrescine transport system ATP-binding protein